MEEKQKRLVLKSQKEIGAKIADRLRSRIEQKCDFTISVGVSDSRVEKGGMENIIKTADEALYKAKKSGRNRVAIYGEPVKMPGMSAGIRY